MSTIKHILRPLLNSLNFIALHYFASTFVRASVHINRHSAHLNLMITVGDVYFINMHLKVCISVITVTYIASDEEVDVNEHLLQKLLQMSSLNHYLLILFSSNFLYILFNRIIWDVDTYEFHFDTLLEMMLGM